MYHLLIHCLSVPDLFDPKFCFVLLGPQTPSLLGQVSPRWDLPLGALETSELEKEEESRRRKMLLPSPTGEPLGCLGLLWASPCCTSSAAEPFLGGTWTQFVDLSTLREAASRAHFPQTPASHRSFIRGLDPSFMTPSLSSETPAPVPPPFSLEVWLWASQGLASKFLRSLCSLVVVAASLSCYFQGTLAFLFNLLSYQLTAF